ncbi:MAG: BatD family protein [Planctomycetaceae bacterium]|nr:BatD family protein [Planctomycetaceae bacterium]
MKHINILLILLLLTLTPVALSATSVILETDRDSLYEGESIFYRITITDEAAIDKSLVADTSAWNGFRSVFHGRDDSSRFSSSYINGKQTSVSQYIARFTYEIFPQKNGNVILPFPKIVLNQKTLLPDRVAVNGREVNRSRLNPDGSLALQVQPPTVQDNVILNLSTSRNTVYPLQPFDIVLTIRMKELRGSYSQDDPLSLLQQPPRLQIAWVETESLQRGIKPQTDRESWLGNIAVRRGGFSINDLVNQDASSAFFAFEPPRAVVRHFAFPSKTVQFPNADGDNVNYREYTLRRTFTADRTGSFDFAAVVLKGAIAVQESASSDMPTSRNIFALSNAVTVNVRDVPTNGRPGNYLGAFGTFDWQVDLQPRKAQLGEPLTLTLSLTGEGSTLDVRPPELDKIPEIKSQFRVLTPTEHSENGTCKFIYSIRPAVAGEIVFPSLEASWFDVATEKFVTQSSEPITLEIEPAGTLTTTEQPASNNTTISETVGVFLNTLDGRGAANDAVEFVPMLVASAVAFVCYAIVLLAAIIYRKRLQNPQAIYRRNAVPRALQRLAAVSNELEKNQYVFTNDVVTAIRAAIIGLVANLTNTNEQGMTTDEVSKHLSGDNVGSECVEKTTSLLKTLDGVCFGGMTADSDLLAEAMEVCKQIDNQRTAFERDSSTNKSAANVTRITLVLATLFVTSCTTPSPEHQQLFDRSRESFNKAVEQTDNEKQKEQYSKTAMLYRQLIESGVRNQTIYLNQSEALALSGQTAKAIAAYRLAERFGTIPTQQTNTLETIMNHKLETKSLLPINIGYYIKIRMMVLISWLTAIIATVTLFKKRHRKLFRNITILCAVLTVLAMTSTLYDYHRYEQTKHAIILNPETHPQKGNSTHYEPTTPPPPYTEAIVKEERGNWLYLKFQNEQRGWLQREDVVIY